MLAAAAASRTGSTAKVHECQCATLPNATKGRCVIACGAEVHKDWVKCRPCAMGNHTGEPCRTPTRDWPFPLIKTCAVCGFDLADHREEDFRRRQDS